jgi:A/G-specific adenine glycosylase
MARQTGDNGNWSIPAFQLSLLRWWRSYRREFPWRRPRTPVYHKIVSEILLQRTRAETVAEFWPRFVSRFPGWRAIASSSVSELEIILRPIGLSRQRAPRLLALAGIMAARRGHFPVHRHQLLALPGIGQYISNSIMLFAHRLPYPLLDVNMARVLERNFGPRKLADIRYDPYLQALAARVASGSKSPQINWAILDLAALVCRSRNPVCQCCPLAQLCHFRRNLVPSWGANDHT